MRSQTIELGALYFPIYQRIDNIVPFGKIFLNFSLNADIGIVLNDKNYINLAIDNPIGKVTLISLYDENNFGKSSTLKIIISQNSNIIGEGNIPISIIKTMGENFSCSLIAKNFIAQPNSITILSSCGTMVFDKNFY